MYILNACIVFSIQSNRTALMVAAERGYLGIVSRLLESGADMDKVSRDLGNSFVGLFFFLFMESKHFDLDLFIFGRYFKDSHRQKHQNSCHLIG